MEELTPRQRAINRDLRLWHVQSRAAMRAWITEFELPGSSFPGRQLDQSGRLAEDLALDHIERILNWKTVDGHSVDLAQWVGQETAAAKPVRGSRYLRSRKGTFNDPK